MWILKNLKTFFFIIIFPFTVLCQDFPEISNPPRLVNDFTGTLSANEKELLENKLVAFNDTASSQIAIVMIHSTGSYEISDYAIRLGEKWGIGREGKNNGALVLVAKDDRNVFIATGYGLEGAIPDALAKRIVEKQIVPAFKQGNYYRGLDDATDTMMKLATGEYEADDLKNKIPVASFIPILFFVFLFGLIIFMKTRSTKRYAAMNGIDFWTAWTLLNAARGAGRGSWGGFSSGSGWGGGSSGGGFGGFGGGSFGGGGAGGSW